MAPPKANELTDSISRSCKSFEILPLSVVWNVKARSPKYLELNIESRYMNRLLCYKYSISVYVLQLRNIACLRFFLNRECKIVWNNSIFLIHHENISEEKNHIFYQILFYVIALYLSHVPHILQQTSTLLSWYVPDLSLFH